MKKSSEGFKAALIGITFITVSVVAILLGQMLINHYTSLLMGM